MRKRNLVFLVIRLRKELNDGNDCCSWLARKTIDASLEDLLQHP